MQLPPAFKNVDFSFFWGGGERKGQGTAEHWLQAVCKCSSEHAVSHALQAEHRDKISRLVSL